MYYHLEYTLGREKGCTSFEDEQFLMIFFKGGIKTLS